MAFENLRKAWDSLKKAQNDVEKRRELLSSKWDEFKSTTANMWKDLNLPEKKFKTKSGAEVNISAQKVEGSNITFQALVELEQLVVDYFAEKEAHANSCYKA